MSPCEDGCARASLSLDLASSTCERLGLDRKGLRRLRKAVQDQLEDDFAVLVIDDGLEEAEATQQIAEEQLLPDPQGRLPRFWSTIRYWAGEIAEELIQQHADRIPGMATP